MAKGLRMNNCDKPQCERWMPRCEPATHYPSWREQTVRSAAVNPCSSLQWRISPGSFMGVWSDDRRVKVSCG